MTTITNTQLVAPVQLTNADAVYYTAPAATAARISRAVFTNTSGSAVTITAYVTTGGAGAAATTLISARSVAAGESYVSPELAGAVLPPASQLRGLCSANTSVTFTVSGVTIV